MAVLAWFWICTKSPGRPMTSAATTRPPVVAALLHLVSPCFAAENNRQGACCLAVSGGRLRERAPSRVLGAGVHRQGIGTDPLRRERQHHRHCTPRIVWHGTARNFSLPNHTAHRNFLYATALKHTTARCRHMMPNSRGPRNRQASIGMPTAQLPGSV